MSKKAGRRDGRHRSRKTIGRRKKMEQPRVYHCAICCDLDGDPGAGLLGDVDNGTVVGDLLAWDDELEEDGIVTPLEWRDQYGSGEGDCVGA